jgi:hypothetical protein
MKLAIETQRRILKMLKSLTEGKATRSDRYISDFAKKITKDLDPDTKKSYMNFNSNNKYRINHGDDEITYEEYLYRKSNNICVGRDASAYVETSETACNNINVTRVKNGLKALTYEEYCYRKLNNLKLNF